MSVSQFERLAATSPDRTLIKIDEYVLDVTSFQERHPGGRQFLVNFKGKDATKVQQIAHFAASTQYCYQCHQRCLYCLVYCHVVLLLLLSGVLWHIQHSHQRSQE